MFYAAYDALLAPRRLSFSSHGAVHRAIGKEFAKTSDLEPKFYRWLVDAYDQRQAATYGISRDIPKDRAQELVLQAEEFLAARAVQLIPDRRKRVAEVSQQIRQHLAHGLRLPRELRQVMPVVNRPLPEPLPRMQDRPHRTAPRSG